MPSVPGYLQAYVQQGRLGNSGGVQYDSWRDRQGNTQYADWATPPTGRNHPDWGRKPTSFNTYGREGTQSGRILNPAYADMNYHDRQRQYWQDQFGDTEGWNRFQADPGQFQGMNQQDRRQGIRDARTEFYQNQWDQRMGGQPESYAKSMIPGEVLMGAMNGGMMPPDGAPPKAGKGGGGMPSNLPMTNPSMMRAPGPPQAGKGGGGMSPPTRQATGRMGADSSQQATGRRGY